MVPLKPGGEAKPQACAGVNGTIVTVGHCNSAYKAREVLQKA